MKVFVPWDGYEAIRGVFLTLEEAVAQKPSEGIEEFEIGKNGRVRGYTNEGELWWEDGKRVPK